PADPRSPRARGSTRSPSRTASPPPAPSPGSPRSCRCPAPPTPAPAPARPVRSPVPVPPRPDPSRAPVCPQSIARAAGPEPAPLGEGLANTVTARRGRAPHPRRPHGHRPCAAGGVPTDPETYLRMLGERLVVDRDRRTYHRPGGGPLGQAARALRAAGVI